MKIANLNIGARLSLGFGIVLAMLVAVSAIGLINLARINAILDDVVNDNNVKSSVVNAMSNAQLRLMIATGNVILVQDPAGMAAQDSLINKANEQYEANLVVLRRLNKSAAGTAILNRIEAAAATTRPLNDKAKKLGHENKTDEATEVLLKEIAPQAALWQSALDEMAVHQQSSNKKSELEAEASYANARNLLLLISAAAIALGVWIAWLATRSITRPMSIAVAIAQTVAAGDLSSRIEVTSTDETGKLLAALKTMNGNLQGIVGQVRSGTETIAAASTQIATGNLDLSARTEQQASSLEETAASMEELNATVKQNADNARQANVLATSASEVAVKGGAVVTQVIETMGSINESSRKIADIIGVIDGIAFQTNILALNAAVEAARAGEQGRGFAVVASEVRNLAQRSASAAKEIKVLIDDSVGKVSRGSALVNTAGSTMEEIVSSVKRVTDIMGEISAAGREQEMGIAQINQAVIEMDSATQQNAALVEEAAAAAESLQDQAAQLTEIVSVFKLDSAQLAAPARARPAAPVLVKPATRQAPPARIAAAAPRKAANGAAPASTEWEEF